VAIAYFHRHPSRLAEGEHHAEATDHEAAPDVEPPSGAGDVAPDAAT
jgi:hypothetical protein